MNLDFWYVHVHNNCIHNDKGSCSWVHGSYSYYTSVYLNIWLAVEQVIIMYNNEKDSCMKSCYLSSDTLEILP